MPTPSELTSGRPPPDIAHASHRNWVLQQPLVGKMLGHRRHATTAGYAHLADDHLVEAAERVGGIIVEAMGLGRGASGP